MLLRLNLTANQAFLFVRPTKAPSTKPFSRIVSTQAPFSMSSDVTSNVGQQLVSSGQNWTNQNDSVGVTEPGWFDRDENLRKAEIAVSATIFYMAFFGNSVVLMVLRLRRQKLTRMQWFIAHLAIADIFVAVFNILPQLIWDITVHFHGNDFMCRTVKYLQVVAMYASSYVLVMAGVDRYLSICHPLTSQTLSPKRVHLMISFSWVVSLVLSLPQVFIFRLTYFDDGGLSSGGYECFGTFSPDWGQKTYVTWIFISVFAFPFLILAFCYGKICHVVWISVGSKESVAYSSVRNGINENHDKSFRMKISFRRMRDYTSSTIPVRDRCETSSIIAGASSVSKKPRGHQRGVSRSKMRTIKLTLTVVLCYMFCWSPFFIVQMLSTFGAQIRLENSAVVIIMLLASLNSCTNPWIYLAFSGCPCTRATPGRGASRSWAPSTHVTSGDSIETKARTSLVDLSHVRMSSRESSPGFLDKIGYLNSAC